jgi:broad specificity phosphatase PhoE
MITIRHSERLDFVDMDNWKKNVKYKTNKHDTPLSQNGKNIAFEKIKDLIKKYEDCEIFDYIYSSPYDRCIQTSLEFQNYIKKNMIG